MSARRGRPERRSARSLSRCSSQHHTMQPRRVGVREKATRQKAPSSWCSLKRLFLAAAFIYFQISTFALVQWVREHGSEWKHESHSQPQQQPAAEISAHENVDSPDPPPLAILLSLLSSAPLLSSHYLFRFRACFLFYPASSLAPNFLITIISYSVKWV